MLPNDRLDRLFLHGYTADVWMQPGVSRAVVQGSAGRAILPEEMSVGLVLGAGNNTSIPPLDVLYRLVAAREATILKLNPVMSGMLQVYSAALAPLIERDLLRIVTGDAGAGAYMAQHPRISHIHVTGSASTRDALIRGQRKSAADGAGRDRGPDAEAFGKGVKPLSSELGGVSPVIVLPGRWSRGDLRYQAEHVVTQRLHNGGHNCVASQVVILSQEWPQRDAFVDQLRRLLSQVPGRRRWYPGTEQAHLRALAAFPDVQPTGPDGDRVLVEAGDDAASLGTTELFAPVLAVVDLPGDGQSFLENAVHYANDELAGTLGANLIAHPKTLARLAVAVENALGDLRYGTVAVNAWTGLGYAAPCAPWGAFPEEDPAVAVSGTGVVHNALLLADPEKTVVRGPFRPFPRSLLAREFSLSPKPPWFVTAANAPTIGRALTKLAGRL